MKKVLVLFSSLMMVTSAVFSQTAANTCASAPFITIPAANSSACYTLTTVGATQDLANTAYCATGAGSAHDVWFKFTTPNVAPTSLDCWNFTLNKGTATGDIQVRLFRSCYTVVGGALGCSATTASFSTSDVTTASTWSPNTTYYLQMSNYGASSAQGTMSLCISRTTRATNDECVGATPISPTQQTGNNNPACVYTEGVTDPAPVNFCAGSLENSAWYSFTTVTAGTVVLSISNISCIGGGSGFQIGYFTGTCGSLSNFGCTSGSGGSVTTTITGLSAGQNVIIGLDGNAGANCTFSISATNTVPLPIELLDLYLSKFPGYVNVNWSTASEKDNSFFTIEKTQDGSHFTEVGKVNGAGNSSSIKDYSFKDEHPFSGISYYRIKQTDHNGAYTYSQMMAVDYNSTLKAGFEIVPNPSDDNSPASLLFTDLKGAECNISVFDITGKKVYSSVEIIKENKFQLPQIQEGVYFIQVSSADFIQTKRMIVN